MSYQLYTNVVYSTIWGDGSGGSQTVSDAYPLSVGAPVVLPYTAFARIPAKQNLVTGGYNGAVTVTIFY